MSGVYARRFSFAPTPILPMILLLRFDSAARLTRRHALFLRHTRRCRYALILRRAALYYYAYAALMPL